MTLRSHLASWISMALLIGCGARTTENNVGNGGNTNWLIGCKSSDSCGEGICASGACTQTCREDDDCSELGSPARCARSAPVVVSANTSCDDAETKRVCVPTCDDEGDCAEIGDGYTCSSGACVPAACTSGQPEPGPETYDPCEGKSCGDSCRECAPQDTECSETEEPKSCNLAGQCVGSEVKCQESNCESAAPGECRTSGCIPIVGAPVRFCEAQGAEAVGCTDQAEQDDAESCALHPDSGECYLFPTTTIPRTWSAVSCEAATCSLTSCDDECFSPKKNLDLAEIDSAAGCACEETGAACVEGLALACYDEKWQSVFDGPCYPVESPCEAYIQDVYTCISKFDNCSETPWGFCGRGRTTSQCADGILVPSQDYCSDEAEQCYQMDDGLWCTGPLSSLCPEHFEVVETCDAPIRSYSCLTPSTAFACQLQTVSEEQCRGLGGDVHGDPGDGGLNEAGCPEGHTTLGVVPGSIEGQLCCRSGETAEPGSDEAADAG